MKTLIMITILKKEIEELECIKDSLVKSNDVGVPAKQYFLPILEKDLNTKMAKLISLERILFFYNKEELNESN